MSSHAYVYAPARTRLLCGRQWHGNTRSSEPSDVLRVTERVFSYIASRHMSPLRRANKSLFTTDRHGPANQRSAETTDRCLTAVNDTFPAYFCSLNPFRRQPLQPVNIAYAQFVMFHFGPSCFALIGKRPQSRWPMCLHRG